MGGGGEPDRVAQVVHPVVHIAMRLLTRIEKGCGVIRNLRHQRGDVVQHAGELFKDRLDLRGMRCDIDRHLARHDVALFPLGDNAANGLGGTADHRGGRGSHNGHHHVLDALLIQFLPDLLCGKFDSGHCAAAGDLHAQQRTTADHLDAVLQRQRA